MLRILIPVYNEEKNIKSCIEGIVESVGKGNYEIIVVNDGSTDTTPIILKKLTHKYPLNIISHKQNLGVSSALESGIRKVVKRGEGEDVVVIMEGDGTSDPRILPKMLEKIEKGYDLVIASRYRKGGEYKNFPARRHFYSLLANFVLRRLFPHPSVSDYTIFYRAYRLKVLKDAFDHYKDNFISHKYFVANTEILIKLMPFVGRVYEVPFIYDYSLKKGKSGLNLRKNVLEYLRFIVNSFFGGLNK